MHRNGSLALWGADGPDIGMAGQRKIKRLEIVHKKYVASSVIPTS